MRIIHIIFILFYCLLPQHTTAQIYKWIDEDGKNQYSDTPPPSYGNPANNPTNILSTHINSSHHENTLSKVSRLFRQEKFKALNQLLSQYQKQVETNIENEDKLFTAYSAFEIRNESFTPLFDKWILSTPNQYQPYLARAHYFYRQGWKARGHDFRNKTSNSQIQGMKKYFNQAVNDIASALTINNQAILPYAMLIGISMNMGTHAKSKVLADEALTISPASFTIRDAYLRSLQPRWGGSLEAMQEFAASSQQYAKDNPRLKLLLGAVFTEMASIERLAKKHGSAEKYYRKALIFGDSPSVFFQQTTNFYWQGKYVDALESINQAIRLHPDDDGYYYWRSKIFIQQQRYGKAATDILSAESLNPYNTAVQNKKKWLAYKLVRQAYDLGKKGKVTKQIEYCSIALRLEPNNALAYSRRARGYTRQNKLELATNDAKEAIRLQPNDITAYDLIDYILAFKEDWNTIIKYWTQYIQLNPKDGHAYIERGGAYYHKGDMKSAFLDAKESARLGNPMGKKMYKQLRKKME